MQYRTLGRTGIQVSPYALGTLMFATVMGNAPEDSARIIGKALDAGINLIDTADAYGDSEEVVGKVLQGRRDEVVLATKFGRPIGQDPNHQGASGRWIVTAVENSLRRLRTDYIDLYQLHRPDPRTDIEETLAALTDLIRSGKVRAIGASQTPASGIVEAQWVRGDPRRADRPDPQRQGPRDRGLADPRLRHRRGPVGRRTARPRAIPHRAAGLLHSQPRHRA